MHLSDDGLVSREELIHMAIKLQEDLRFCEDKLGGHRDFAELRSSANALIRAILAAGAVSTVYVCAHEARTKRPVYARKKMYPGFAPLG